MKKKWTALLLACAMTVPYGTMPVYAGALDQAETGGTESYETQSYGIESYETERYDSEAGTEQEILDQYDVLETQEAPGDGSVLAASDKVGGGINWDYPDNIIPADNAAASEGCLLAGVKGSYLADAKNALKLINQYRKEACDKGYPDPRDSKP